MDEVRRVYVFNFVANDIIYAVGGWDAPKSFESIGLKDAKEWRNNWRMDEWEGKIKKV